MKARLIALFLLASIVFFALCGTVWAGYSTTKLTDNSYTARINGSGQVAWKSYDGKIYLYSDGTTTLVDDSYGGNAYNYSPQLNDSGQVIWASYNPAPPEMAALGHPGDFYIKVYSGGTYTSLFSCYACGQPFMYSSAQINNDGQAVWSYNGIIYLYSGGTVTQLTDTISENPQINDTGQIVWEAAAGQIFLHSDGVTRQLADSGMNPQINDPGQVVWSNWDFSSGVDIGYEIYRYDGGTTTRIERRTYSAPFPDSSPQINDFGQVVWKEEDIGCHFAIGPGCYPEYGLYLNVGGITTRLGSVYEGSESPFQINNASQVVWSWRGINLFSGGSTSQIVNYDNGIMSREPQINDAGQVVWGGYDGNAWGIYLTSPSSCSGERPSLALSRGDVFWESYADYLAGELSVTMTVSNPGTVSTSQVQIIGSINTSGATLSTAVPALVGDIASGASGTVALKYHVPTGVGAFMTTVYATAQDSCGTTYSYPGPYPGL